MVLVVIVRYSVCLYFDADIGIRLCIAGLSYKQTTGSDEIIGLVNIYCRMLSVSNRYVEVYLNTMGLVGRAVSIRTTFIITGEHHPVGLKLQRFQHIWM